MVKKLRLEMNLMIDQIIIMFSPKAISTRDSGAPHGGAAGILLTGWSVRFPMADDRRISGACTVHLARSGSLPMVQLAATLAGFHTATAQIY